MFALPRLHVSARAAALMVAMLAPAAHAVTWTDWTSANATSASGIAGTVAVSFSSTASLWGWQTTPGTNYYSPWPGGADQPDNTDILMFGAAGVRTITFSQAVTNVQLALVSWNVGGNITFNHAFASAVIGCGFWGCGSINPINSNTGFTANGEVHGTLTFAGPIQTLVIQDGAENWHGVTVGIGAVVPEPSTYLMMVLGLAGLGAGARRRA